jgi:hypothetical protein
MWNPDKARDGIRLRQAGHPARAMIEAPFRRRNAGGLDTPPSPERFVISFSIS